METGPGDWPSERWRLTAPESYVLQIPRPLSSVEAFKLALRELALLRALRVEQLEEAGFLGRRRRRTVLRTGTQRVSEPALTPLVELHSRTRERDGLDGVLVEDYAKQARRAFTRSLAGYVDDHVYPALAERGLMELQVSGPFRRRRHVRTEAGEQAAAELDAWLRVGRERIEEWAREHPERVLAYAGGAGAAILLMRDLYPEFERIGRNALMGGDQASVGGEAGAFGDTGGDSFDAFDSFDSFDSFDAFDGIDAGVDAGGGFGGDGGGGDGGGGGNGGG